MRVEIQNFQAIANASFEINGFTALVGRSNIGKSAVVRALKCALTGASGTDFVRHDPKSCERVLKGNKACKCFSAVTLFFDNGDKLLWEKGDKKNQYTTWSNGDKQEYTRVGKNPEMPPMLKGFDSIQLGARDRELVQVADQFDGPIFLLNVPGPTVADLLSDVAQLDDINQAMRLVTKDRKEASSTRKVREKDIVDIESNLKAYTGLDNTAVRVNKSQETYATLQKLSSSVAEASRFLRNFADIAVAVRGLKAALEPEIPDDNPLEVNLVSLKTILRFTHDYGRQTVDVRGLKAALEPEIPDDNPLEVNLASLNRVSRLLPDYDRQTTAVEELSGVEDVGLPKPLEVLPTLDTIGKVDSWMDQLKGIKATVNVFNKLSELSLATEPPTGFQAVSQLRKLDSLRSELDELEEDIASLESGLESVTLELETLHDEYKGIDSCPVCTQEMPAHLLTEAP